MSQPEEFSGSLSIPLLPGDRAPALRLARVFNRGGQPIEQVAFDRLTAVILWNAACVGCLPAVAEAAALGAAHDVPVYGVAVMVRDVERTAAAAREGGELAILALEERPADPIGLMRGSVTRDYLEASGLQGVPAAFLISANGRVLWIGEPADLAHVMPAAADGSWDVASARAEWRLAIKPQEIEQLRLVRDVTDALVAGQVDAARELIAVGEQAMPGLADDSEFAILKFQALAAAPLQLIASTDHYREAAARFPDDLRLQTMFGGCAVRQLSGHPEILQLAAQALAKVSDGPAASVGEAQSRILCRLLEAEASARLGWSEQAVIALERASVLAGSENLPDAARDWATKEVDRVRKLVPNS